MFNVELWRPKQFFCSWFCLGRWGHFSILHHEHLEEKQLEAACKKLWVAVHGSEYDIQSTVRNERREGGTNQAILARLNKYLGGWRS